MGYLLLAGTGCAGVIGPEVITTYLPPSDSEAGRWAVLDGANNTRDIGGYHTQDGHTVRWAMVYRSGELSGLTDAGCQAFHNLGIRRVVDFRYRVASSPLFGGDVPCVFDAATVTLLQVRLSSGDDFAPAYVQMAQNNSESYRRAFELLADPANLPLLFHCLAGKDRTGLMVALLLRLLGVDRETVIADYELSNLVNASVNKQAMIDLLDEVDRQGGIADYLAAIGVTSETQTAVRANLRD